MIKTVRFEPWHLEAIAEDLKETFHGDENQILRLLELAKHPASCCHTIVSQSAESLEIIGMIGLVVYWQGMAESFAFLSNKVRKYPVAFCREAKKVVDFFFENLKLRRLQTTVSVKFPEAKAWVEFLGFHKESILENFGPGGDPCLMMARCQKRGE